MLVLWTQKYSFGLVDQGSEQRRQLSKLVTEGRRRSEDSLASAAGSRQTG